MANYRKAPRLIHNGSKSKGLFYQLPQNMVENIFQNFDDKCGNQIKLLIALLGNKGDGSFRLSEEWITQHTGMSKSNYHRTMDSLVEKGYVTRENGRVILNLPLLLEDYHDEQEGSHQEDESTREDENSVHDDAYNIEIINNKINNLINDKKSVNDQKGMLKELLGCVQIHYAPNTYKAMAEIIGEEPQANVLAALLTNNLDTLMGAASMPQSYRYGILTKLLNAEYHTLKEELSIKSSAEDTHTDAPVDIDELLADWFLDDDL